MHEPMGGDGVCTVHWSVCAVLLSVGYAAGGSLDAEWMDGCILQDWIWCHGYIMSQKLYIKQNLVSRTSVENEFGWRCWCLNLFFFFFPLAVKRLI